MLPEAVSPSPPPGPPVRTRSSYHLSEVFEFNGKKHYTYKVGTTHSRSKLASVAGRGCLLPPPCSSPLTLYAPPPLQDAVASIMGGHHPVILAFIQYLNMFLAAVG